jgi:caa(3)-type oxidase subunit IV
MTPAQHSPQGQSLGWLVLAGALLLAFAALSYGLSFVALGRLGLPIALAIAACKALTVLFVFMEFGGLPASAKLAAAAALLMVALLVGLMVADVATRERAPLPPPKISQPLWRVQMGTLEGARSQPMKIGKVSDTLHQARRHGMDADSFGWSFQLAHTAGSKLLGASEIRGRS